MTNLLITRGLQASGKTTYAKAWVAEAPLERARVNRDDLRATLKGGYHAAVERDVIAARDALVTELLSRGVDVICDDTNLPSRTVRDLARLAARAKAEFTVIDLTDVPLDVCIARDAQREKAVGEHVIRDTWTRFLKGRAHPLPLPSEPADAPSGVKPYEPKPGTPRTALVDIDGTVAIMGDRSPYDETRVHIDRPNLPIIAVVRALHATDHRIVFMSGRTEACREATERWLDRNVLRAYDALHMRAVGDNRKDAIVKAELFDAHVRDNYDVACVLDDRDVCIKLWRDMGIAALQVNYGDF